MIMNNGTVMIMDQPTESVRGIGHDMVRNIMGGFCCQWSVDGQLQMQQ